MGRELQKKKRRSGVTKRAGSSANPKRRQKKTFKPLLANDFLAANWDKRQTVSQNYARLGLTRKLNGPTGGVERHRPGEGSGSVAETLAIAPGRTSGQDAGISEAKIERDARTGAILRVVRGESEQGSDADSDEDEDDDIPRNAHQHDPNHHVNRLKPLSKATKQSNPGSVAAILEIQAAQAGARPKKPRMPSVREAEWLQRLIDKYGVDDARCFERMARDQELNVRQQSAGDIKRRVQRLRGIAS